MRDRVLHQRLQQQGRHQAREGALVHARREVQARAEAHALDGQEVLGEGQLFREGHTLARAQSQAAPQKVREEDAHPARFLGPAADERVDGVQAVEQEVGVDLGAQGAQLRLARQDLETQGLGLGPARVLERDEQVVQRRGEEEQEEAHAEEQGRRSPLAVDQAREETEALERGRPEARREEPQRRRQRRRRELRARHRKEAGAQRGGPARPEGAEAYERVEGGQRHGERQGGGPVEVAAEDEECRQQPSQQLPGCDIREEAAPVRQDRMH